MYINIIFNAFGKLDTNSGLKVTPNPNPIDVAIINKFLFQHR